MAESTNTRSVLLGLGNPLLDIIAKVDDAFLAKYDLKANDAILADDRHDAMFQELEHTYSPEYFVGGATQNSARIAQWLIGTPKSFSFMGCVGVDTHARQLEQKATQDGVDCRYQHHAQTPTGRCAVLLTKGGACRSLVTNLGAAEKFTVNHLHTRANEQLIKDVQFFYVSSFFYSVCVQTIMELGEEACRANKVFCLNLSAPFLCDVYGPQMMATMPYVDIVVGNNEEADAFARSHNFQLNDVGKIALKISALPKRNSKKPRLVIITQGADNIIVAQDGTVRSLPVEKLAKDKIVDTNGAGDSFVGGFLAQLVQGKDIDDCIKCGMWAATQIIQQVGCNVPTDTKYNP